MKDLYNENFKTLKKRKLKGKGMLQDERPSVLLGWQNSYQEIDFTTKTNLQI